jgi:hypothetical protein
MSAFQPNKFQPIWRYIQKDMAVLILVVGSSRKSRSLSISLIFVVPFLLSPSWAAALPKNLHRSISLLPKQQHMSFSRAEQQYLVMGRPSPFGQQPTQGATKQHIHVTCSSCSNLQLLDSILQHLDSSICSTSPRLAALPPSLDSILQHLDSTLQHLTAWTATPAAHLHARQQPAALCCTSSSHGQQLMHVQQLPKTSTELSKTRAAHPADTHTDQQIFPLLGFLLDH